MELYAGLDLHSRNTYVGILDANLNRIFKKRVHNDLDLILKTLDPFRDQLKGLVAVSTFNWYWLVDGLANAGYQTLHLANPSAIKQSEGLKHSDDQHDAFFLAQLLILGILPQGYIYPKESRPVRDLARKRMFLVQHKTAHILSLQSLFQRCCAFKLSNLLNSVSSNRLSDGKIKGHGNSKNGNRYLSWAFVEAAHATRRYNERFKTYYNRKVAQTNTSLASKALSNKLARICYYIIRDQVPFREGLTVH